MKEIIAPSYDNYTLSTSGRPTRSQSVLFHRLVIAAGTITALALPATAQTSLVFRDGLNGYDSTLDIEIRSSGTTPSSSAVTISVDGSDGGATVQALMRFDSIFGSAVTQIQPFSLINSATLQIRTFDLGDTINMHRMLVTWNNSSTWTSLVGGISANNTEAATTATATFTPSTTGANVTMNVLNDVLAWHGGATNFGWAFLPTGTNGWDFYTSENTDLPSRPQLTVNIDAPRAWVGGDTTRGGTGTWANTGGTSWATTNADVAGGAWATTSPALFAANAASTVTVSGAVTATGGMLFLFPGQSSITGGTSITLGAAGARSTIFTDTGATATIATPLAGTGGMTKTGTGTLVLTGTNTYTGGTTVSAGSLQLGDGTTNGVITGNITNNSGISFNLGSAQTFGGNITGTGTLLKTGPGTLTLSGTNGFTGKTTITGGLVSISGEARLGGNPGAFSADQITLNGGGVQAAPGSSVNFSSNRGITLGAGGGTFDSAGTDTVTLTNVVTGTGSLTKTGSGNLVFAGAHTYTGGTNIREGRATLTAANRLPTATALTLGFDTTSGTLALTGFNQTVATIATSGTGTANTIENAGATSATLIVSGSASGTFSGTLRNGTGAGALLLTKSGAGTLTLGGDNSYTGQTAISGGTLVAAATSGQQALGGTTAITVSAATLRLDGSNQINNAASLTMNGGTLNLNGFSEGAEGVSGIGSLNLTGTSTIDFGAPGVGANVIQFGGLGVGQIGNLQIINFDGTADRLFFAGNLSTFTSEFQQGEVFFNGNPGYVAEQFSGYYAITIPEPASLLPLGAFMALAGFRRRRSS